MIDIIIVEDDENAAASLEMMLEDTCIEHRILDIAPSLAKAVELVDKKKPSLVFLDIELPDGYGYDLFRKTKFKNYKIIFTTTHSQYAVQAFELSALHYLMKPFDGKALAEALKRYTTTTESEMLDKKLEILKASMIERPEKIILPNAGGSLVHNINDIVHCESDNNYCYVSFVNGSRELITRSLKDMERALNDSGFVRIHGSHLINLRYIKKYQTGNNHRVILSNNLEFPVTDTYRQNFAERLQQFARKI